ncbi:MAG: hypothetical protein EZS28_030821 [Streblomastix strix]|uniref:Uncharacterized protein n=1 Tax=Streblomastix strix TaxID=222440 RepID=A0A5J4UTS6_9EUKA|nr:MAG: hypothetical protein EZS28_030821 [Streblomastix strix]
MDGCSPDTGVWESLLPGKDKQANISFSSKNSDSDYNCFFIIVSKTEVLRSSKVDVLTFDASGSKTDLKGETTFWSSSGQNGREETSMSSTFVNHKYFLKPLILALKKDTSVMYFQHHPPAQKRYSSEPKTAEESEQL